MVYNYIRSGRIKARPCGEHNNTLCVDQEEAERWLQARSEKEQRKYEEIQRQLRGEV